MPLYAISKKAVANWDKSTAPADDYPGVTGGSALLWRTVEGHFLVTAFHVWERLEALRKRDQYRMVTGDRSGIMLIDGPTLVSWDRDLDLAVFTVNRLAEFRPTGKSFYTSLVWPVRPTAPDDVIVGCGYPGSGRVKRKGILHSMIAGFAFRTVEISKYGRQLVFYGDKGKAEHYTDWQPPPISLPGMSGGPVFALRDDRLDWIGTIIEGSEVGGLTKVVVRPSSFISADGRIDPAL